MRIPYFDDRTIISRTKPNLNNDVTEHYETIDPPTTLNTAYKSLYESIQQMPTWKMVLFLPIIYLPKNPTLPALKKLQEYLNYPTFFYYLYYIFPEFKQFAQTQTAKINLILAPNYTPVEQEYLFKLLSDFVYSYQSPSEDESEIELLIAQVCMQLNSNNTTDERELKLRQSLLQKLDPKLSSKSSSTLPKSSWEKMQSQMPSSKKCQSIHNDAPHPLKSAFANKSKSENISKQRHVHFQIENDGKRFRAPCL